ncbi:hypothetical protein DSM3645_29966 [Blastopirellula marina DSM 3645]|uniref:Uncharacterized protein n=1 Tax=Blastopirellula marina DSM 3645 TaxID=314230 RepID=A3ZXL8_9BACT|nr:hypothetical protein DSM3645_29966 [Blastopirellula marina DSM 3645]
MIEAITYSFQGNSLCPIPIPFPSGFAAWKMEMPMPLKSFGTAFLRD